MHTITGDVRAFDRNTVLKGAVKGKLYIKPLEDGSVAVAMFNLSDQPKMIGFIPHAIGLTADQSIRDLWRQKDLGKVGRKDRWETEVAPHGVVFVKLSPGVTGEKLHGFFR